MDWRKVGVLNLMLVFLPMAFILEWTGASGLWVFVTACAAIIPLAGLMGKSTEMIAERVGPGIGGLLNASFGNAAELIIAIVALREGMIEVVKASLTGSILGNILLVLGASLFAGGLKFQRQKFNATAAGISATMLALAAVGLLVPAMFHAHLVIHHQQADERTLSLEISIVLFIVYLVMLYFSLVTHKHLYSPGHGAETPDTHDTKQPPGVADPHGESFADVEGHWSMSLSIGVLVGATICVALVSEVLIGAVEEASHQLGLNDVFIGVIVVAIIGNAAEHSTAILVAVKNRMDLSFQIAVGSGLQIALFVAPLLVFLSYLPGFPVLDLRFSMLEVVSVGVSVLIVGLVALDGESNWMEGLLLLAVYVILAIAFFNLPQDEPHDAEARLTSPAMMAFDAVAAIDGHTEDANRNTSRPRSESAPRVPGDALTLPGFWRPAGLTAERSLVFQEIG